MRPCHADQGWLGVGINSTARLHVADVVAGAIAIVRPNGARLAAPAPKELVCRVMANSGS